MQSLLLTIRVCCALQCTIYTMHFHLLSEFCKAYAMSDHHSRYALLWCNVEAVVAVVICPQPAPAQLLSYTGSFHGFAGSRDFAVKIIVVDFFIISKSQFHSKHFHHIACPTLYLLQMPDCSISYKDFWGRGYAPSYDGLFVCLLACCIFLSFFMSCPELSCIDDAQCTYILDFCDTVVLT